ncbi:MAG: ATP-binding cassette domain-containing protein [Rhodoferax sp.]|nr:ATP-binding cassette domain-containing protein [Rhodoferax sp.]
MNVSPAGTRIRIEGQAMAQPVIPQADTSTALLQVDALCKHYPSADGPPVLALNRVSFRLYERRTLGVVGESGCGKSTLGRTLMRLLDASSGSVQFDGIDWISAAARPGREDRRRMQMVFQDPFSSLNPKHRVGNIVREPLDIHAGSSSRAQRRSKVQDLLATVGLTARDGDKFPHEFSGGQRQRIAIARALALEPRLLIADEPVSALDVSIQSQILNLLMSLRQQRDMAMIFISHDLSVVRHVSDDVAVMYFGSIVEMASASAIFRTPAHPYTQLLLSSIPARSRVGGYVAAAGTLELAGAELPDAAKPPSGCAFAPRCPHAMARCQTEAPQLLTRQLPQPGHTALVACHLLPEAVVA